MSSPVLTIVVPVFNDERTLHLLVERLHAACGDAQIIFVDDGSTDASLEIVRSAARPSDLVFTKEHAGKGSAVRLGFRHARGKYTMVQEGGLEYAPEGIPDLLAYAEAHDCAALFGSRRLQKQKHVDFSHRMGEWLMTRMCNILYRTRLTDQPTCYKMVRTDVLRTLPLRENDSRVDPEMTVLLARRGVHIAEQPVSFKPDTAAKKKKHYWKHWFRCTGVLLKYRFVRASKLVA